MRSRGWGSPPRPPPSTPSVARSRTPPPRANSPLQVMYRVDGASSLDEQELNHLDGYRRSRPVRIGNGAASQLQLDIYGELFDAIYIAGRQALAGHGELIAYDDW